VELYRLIGIPTLPLWVIESPTDIQIQLLLYTQLLLLYFG